MAPSLIEQFFKEGIIDGQKCIVNYCTKWKRFFVVNKHSAANERGVTGTNGL
ncbi:MAG: hypothetical protein AAB332_04530 [Planctomycetota bacterium]